MKDILFDSYRQYQKESKESTIKAFFKLPVPAMVLLCVSLACVVFNFVVIICNLVASLGIVCLMAEIAIYIVLYLYTDSYQIKASNTRVKTYVKYCSDLLTWFRKAGFVASKENLLELISRVDEHINDSQQRKKNNQQRFDKWCQALLFPIVLAIFSTVIKDQTDVMLMLSYAVIIILAIGLLYLGAYHCLNIISFFEKRKIAQMKSFADDLQGIMDTQFDNKMVEVLSDNASEELAAQQPGNTK